MRAKLLVASTNQNKVREIRAVLDQAPIEIITLTDVPPVPEPEETADTFWENARQKALAYAQLTGVTAVAEDSGLEIDALGGEPGVKSARFLGPNVPYPKRFTEIYERLAVQPHRSRDARFVTALVVAQPDGTILYETEGVIEGLVAGQPTGTHGFGYDPILFYPPLGKTLAELTLDEKCAVSHRARVFRDLARHFLQRGLPPAGCGQLA
jgi:XTP/dITP diphosphohydrolase